MKSRWYVIAAGIGLSAMLFSSCSRWFKPAAPRLAVVIVVDQMRYDYLVRFTGLFSGGLAKLLREGAVFTDAHHDHANTETAPGHATLLTGSHPSHHGIIANNFYERQLGREVYCVDDSGFAVVKSDEKAAKNPPSRSGKSPRKLRRSTLGDWLKAKNPAAKVISIAGKDRSAILMAGFEAEAAYWFDTSSGGFVSSRYYLDALPAWAAQWNAARHADRYYGKAWEKSRPEKDYFVSREDFFSAEGDGEHTTFPHEFASEQGATANAINRRFYEWLAKTPFADALALEFAQQAVQAEQLGVDAVPDLLLIGLSATDLIGHDFGPLSQESEDNLLRLDAALEKFFAFLDAQVGLKNCVIALSADHGVLPLPEELRRRGFESARILYDEAFEEVKGVEREMQQEWRTNRRLLRAFGADIVLDFRVADSLGLSPAAFRSQVAAKLRTLSFVSDVFTRDELQASDRPTREFLEKQRHSFHPERSVDLVLQLKPFYLVSNRSQGTTHGSPYHYDSHVPMIFWGERIKPGRIDSPAKTVDLAPTLAYLLHLDLSSLKSQQAGRGAVESGVDGEVLKIALQE
ncbi:MAG: alkaline phosphatase family protein [candidate division KSB1 bacterium]|nr:alkaline phosphatase family protein [candidate division KSB1 bacterium]MDZ7368944.1 alkaline phosphatase family protein [candidate division KSB1 bacterium]MDZ7406932.1 alkaline phosphatase family protein [candidate division KSB1 bacterium]